MLAMSVKIYDQIIKLAIGHLFPINLNINTLAARPDHSQLPKSENCDFEDRSFGNFDNREIDISYICWQPPDVKWCGGKTAVFLFHKNNIYRARPTITI